MEIRKILLPEFNEIASYLESNGDTPKCFNYGYLWECLHPDHFLSLINISSGSHYEHILYHFSDDGNHVFEEWSKNMELNRNKIHGILRKNFAGDIYVNEFQTDDQIIESIRREMIFDDFNKNKFSQKNEYTLKFLVDDKESAIQLFSEQWWEIDDARKFVETGCANPNGIIVTGFLNNTPVGIVKAAFFEQTAWILAVYVKDGMRGRGVGRQIISRMLLELSEKGIGQVGLGVGEDHCQAVQLYKSVGFKFSKFLRYRIKIT